MLRSSSLDTAFSVRTCTGRVDQKVQRARTANRVVVIMMHFTRSVCVKDRMMREDAVGHVTLDNVIGAMLKSEDHWNNVASYVEEVLRRKKKFEQKTASIAL